MTNSNQIAIQYILNKAFKKLDQNSKNLYHVVITDLKAKHSKDYIFKTGTYLLKPLFKESKLQGGFMDYVNIIEYSSDISKGGLTKDIKDLGLHSHIIINTTLPETSVQHYANSVFGKGVDVFVENITNNHSRHKVYDYLQKQVHILTDDSYKIMIGNPTKNKQY